MINYNKRNKLIRKTLNISIIICVLFFGGYILYKVIEKKNSLLILFNFFNQQSLSNLQLKPIKLNGFSQGGNEYSFTSKSISNYIATFFDSQNVAFKDIVVTLSKNTSNPINIISKLGDYNDKNKEFLLYNDVNIESKTYKIMLNKLIVDFKNSKIYSNDSIFGKYNNIHIQSEKIEIINNFTTINLYNNVKIHVQE